MFLTLLLSLDLPARKHCSFIISNYALSQLLIYFYVFPSTVTSDQKIARKYITKPDTFKYPNKIWFTQLDNKTWYTPSKGRSTVREPLCKKIANKI